MMLPMATIFVSSSDSLKKELKKFLIALSPEVSPVSRLRVTFPRQCFYLIGNRKLSGIPDELLVEGRGGVEWVWATLRRISIAFMG